jgi:hypothetical protein
MVRSRSGAFVGALIEIDLWKVFDFCVCRGKRYLWTIHTISLCGLAFIIGERLMSITARRAMDARARLWPWVVLRLRRSFIRESETDSRAQFFDGYTHFFKSISIRQIPSVDVRFLAHEFMCQRFQKIYYHVLPSVCVFGFVREADKPSNANNKDNHS